jgi:predicted kinase
LFEQLDTELTRIDRSIEVRRKRGKVRRGHGDLHLRNICLFEGEPTPFDALEFDERLATTDVLYDLAFLIMDMRHAGLAAQANAVMNAYWDAAGEDEAALDLLPFFMSLRAAVRMAVAVETAKLEEAHRYRQLGLALLAPAPARLVAIGGLSGVGKSAVAEALAPMLPGPAGARLLRSDVLRKRMLGLALEERAHESAYASERQAAVYQELAARAEDALANHASVVADATFRTMLQRESIRRAAHGAAFAGYWLRAPLHIRLKRVAQRFGDASDADVNVAAEQKEPSDLPAFWRTLDASASSPAELAEAIRSDFPLAGERSASMMK